MFFEISLLSYERSKNVYKRSEVALDFVQISLVICHFLSWFETFFSRI